MSETPPKDYVVVVQCHIVKERCPGYFCEKAFHERIDGFAGYPKDRPMRMLAITCGGCCGRAVHRKLASLVKKIAKEQIGRERIVVRLASCITHDNYHGPACPHLAYLKEVIGKLNLDIASGTKFSKKAAERRAAGIYRS